MLYQEFFIPDKSVMQVNRGSGAPDIYHIVFVYPLMWFFFAQSQSKSRQAHSDGLEKSPTPAANGINLL